MKNGIVILSKRSGELAAAMRSRAAERKLDVLPRPADGLEGVKNLLWEFDTAALVLDWRAEGAESLLAEISADEVFGTLPVLVMVPDDADTFRAVLGSGTKSAVLMSETADPALIAENALLLHIRFRRDANAGETLATLKNELVQGAILVDIIRKYVSATVWEIARGLSKEQRIVVPDQETELTLVFGDINGFTQMAESLQPADAIRDLNEVFRVTNEVIYRHGGDIDKYIGDAFFAVFEDPTSAVKAMREIQLRMKSLNRERVARDDSPFLLRIGIHTGKVIRGNVGSDLRYDNTLIGDTVNTASRLEKLAPPGGLLISEECCALTALHLPSAASRITVTLRGRSQQTTAFSIADPSHLVFG